MATATASGLNILAMDGGGVRGLSQLLILQHIMQRIGNYPGTDRLVKPHEVFDLICGTSAGGLSALMLGRLQMSVSQCIGYYSDIMQKAFQAKKTKFLPHFDAFDEKVLEAEFKTLIRNQGASNHDREHMLDLRASACKVFVCATSGATPGDRIPRRFRTYNVNEPSHDVEIWEAARATTAAPRYFKPITIRLPHGDIEETFVDGGIGCNNPSQEAYFEVRDVLMPTNPCFNCFLSIGTGKAPAATTPRRDLLNLFLPIDWIEVLKAAATSCADIDRSMENLFRDHEGVYYRLDAPGMEQIGLDEWKRADVIKANTNRYTTSSLAMRRTIDAIAAKLLPKITMAAPQAQSPPLIAPSLATNLSDHNSRNLQRNARLPETRRSGMTVNVVDVNRPQDQPVQRFSELPNLADYDELLQRSRSWQIGSKPNRHETRPRLTRQTTSSSLQGHTVSPPIRSLTEPFGSNSNAATSWKPDLLVAEEMLEEAVFEETDESTKLTSADALLQQYVMLPAGLSEADRTFINSSGATIHILRTSHNIEEQDQKLQEHLQMLADEERRQWAVFEAEFLDHLLPELSNPASLFRIKNLKADPCEKTGDWITDKTEYIAWSTQLEPQVLMISGPPGQGKSVLAKHIALHLSHTDKSALVVDVFCQDSLRYNTSLYIVRSIIYQVLSARRHLFRHVRHSVWIESDTEQSHTFEKYWKLLLNILADPKMQDMYCIIDGIDECQANAQEQFLQALYRDLQNTNASDRVIARKGRFLLTTRETALANQKSLLAGHIRIQAEDTRKDITCYALHEFQKFRAVVGSDDWAEIFAMILADYSEGMFLFVSLVLEEIRNSGGSLNLKQLSISAQAGLDRLSGLYANILQRIPSTRLPEARKILEILLFSRFTISTSEFDFAMAFLEADEVSRDLLDDHQGASCAFIAKELCGSLVEISNGSIRFNHHSISQFLLNGPKLDNFPEEFTFDTEAAHLKRLSLCLKYLLMEDLELNSDENSVTVNTVRSPYLLEAMLAWPHHLRDANEKIKSIIPLLRRFIQSTQIIDSLRAVRSLNDYFEQDVLDRSQLLLEVVLIFGLVNVLKLIKFSPSIETNHLPSEDELFVLPASILRAQSPKGLDVLSMAISSNQKHGNKVALVRQLLLMGLTPAESPEGITSLLASAQDGDVDVLKLMLPHVSNINYAGTQGYTVLMMACEHGNLQAVNYLLQQPGIDVNKKAQTGWSSLHIAAAEGQGEVVRSLLNAGAVQCPNDDGWSPLHLASSEGNVDVVQALLFKGAVVDALGPKDWTALHVAAVNGHVKTFEFLLEWGASTQLPSDTGVVPLHLAVNAENESIVNMILAKEQVSVHIPGDVDCETALHMAARCSNSDIAKALIDAGADVNTISGQFKSPLEIAACCGHLEVVKTLIQANADVGFEARNAIPMLHVSIFAGYTEVAKLLIDKGASCNTCWSTHYTPAFVAAWKNQPTILSLLMKRKVDLAVASESGKSILHFLAESGHDELIAQLIKKGVRPNPVTEEGYTPLHFAAAAGRLSTVRVLLKHGAPMNVAPKPKHITPLLTSIAHKHKNIADYLLEHSADAKKATDGGYTVVHAAAAADFPELIRRFCEVNQLGVDSETKDGWQPIHAAAEKGNIRSLEELLRRDADANAKTNWDVTPLHLACDHGHFTAIKSLLREKAIVDCVTKDGTTPLSFLASNANAEAAIQSLYDQGGKASINKENTDGRIALHAAARMGRFRNAQLLMSFGEDPNHMDHYQFTPLDEAAGNYDVAMVKEMVTHGARFDHLDGFCRSALSCLEEAGIDTKAEFPNEVAPSLPDDTAYRTQIACVADAARVKLCAGNLIDDHYSFFVLGQCLSILGDFEGTAICGEQRIWYVDGEARHTAICDIGGHEIVGKRMKCSKCSNQDLCSDHYEEYKEKDLTIRNCHRHTFVQIPRDIASSLETGQVNEQGQDLRSWLTSLDFDR